MKVLLASILVAASLGLSACSAWTATLEIDCAEFQEDQHFTWEVDVSPGDSVVVALCANPSTGFQWSESAVMSDDTVVRQVSHKHVPAKGDDTVGSAGREVWTFKALSSGTSSISMQYEQPWEGGLKREWTFTATVTVE
jgi:inhibitor of cysteine peptidase